MKLLIYGLFIYQIISAPAFSINRVCVYEGKEIDLEDATAIKGKTGFVLCKTDVSKSLERAVMLKNGLIVKEKIRLDDGLYTEYDLDTKGNKTGFVRKTTEGGKLLNEESFINGEAVGWGKELFESQKIKRHYFHESGNIIFEVTFTEKGEMTNLICANRDLKGVDSEYCGWKGPKEIKLYNGQGLYNKHTMQNGNIKDMVAQVDKNTEIISTKTGSNENQITIKRKDQGITKIAVKNNQPHGISNEYDKDGNLLITSQWELGKIVGETTYYLNKNIQKQISFIKDLNQSKISYKNYSDKKVLLEEGSYLPSYYQEKWEGMVVERWNLDEKNLGLHKMYYETGGLRLSRKFNKDSKLEGEEISYYPDKKIESIRSYKNGDIYHVKEIDSKGQITRDDEVFKDGSVKKK